MRSNRRRIGRTAVLSGLTLAVPALLPAGIAAARDADAPIIVAQTFRPPQANQQGQPTEEGKGDQRGRKRGDGAHGGGGGGGGGGDGARGGGGREGRGGSHGGGREGRGGGVPVQQPAMQQPPAPRVTTPPTVAPRVTTPPPTVTPPRVTTPTVTAPNKLNTGPSTLPSRVEQDVRRGRGEGRGEGRGDGRNNFDRGGPRGNEPPKTLDVKPVQAPNPVNVAPRDARDGRDRDGRDHDRGEGRVGPRFRDGISPGKPDPRDVRDGRDGRDHDRGEGRVGPRFRDGISPGKPDPRDVRDGRDRDDRDRRDSDRVQEFREQMKGRFKVRREDEPDRNRFRNIEALRGDRKERRGEGGRIFLEEPDRRMIVRGGDKAFIIRDETRRFRRFDRDATTRKRPDGRTLMSVRRPGGYEIFNETGPDGRLVRRYRRGPDGREVNLIDNRRTWRRWKRNAGIGFMVGIGAPVFSMPRDRYIVDYERASYDDIYDALSAPPVDDIDDRYTLDEVLSTYNLRERMRRVDLDSINFEFGSWEVGEGQYDKLERIARAINRIIQIEGHTDAVRDETDNLSLSDRRAEEVANILSQEFDVPPENLVTQGYGEQFLKVDTDGPERANRRVTARRITPLLSRNER
mgnify:CR=1 FL=1